MSGENNPNVISQMGSRNMENSNVERDLGVTVDSKLDMSLNVLQQQER